MILWDLKDHNFYVPLSDEINKVWVCCAILNQSDSNKPMPINVMLTGIFCKFFGTVKFPDEIYSSYPQYVVYFVSLLVLKHSL